MRRGLDSGTCKGCAAPIWWARRLSGKAQPLNRAPDQAGNIVMENGIAVQFQPLIHSDGRDRFMPHHATCPNANDFRKAKK